MAVKNYKCPGCGASMVYEEGSNSMVCPYCNRKVPVEQAEKEQEAEARSPKMKSGTARTQKKEKDSRGTGALDASGAGQKVFHCSNCGAELIADEQTAATFCSFCGSPTLIEERLSGEWMPDYVIPFQLDKKQAQEIFRKWTRKGILTPREFSSQATLDSISGIYVPYWLYDMGVRVTMEADAERTRIERHGDTEHMITDHYLLERRTTSQFERIPADASEKMPDDSMERLEPFDYEKLRPFELPYLSGFLAERYEHTDAEMAERAKERAAEYAKAETEKTMTGYDGIVVKRNEVSIARNQTEYAMLPVWVLSYRYQGKNWMLYLNGQTGRRVGKLPISKLRTAAAFVISSVAVFAVSMLLGGLL